MSIALDLRWTTVSVIMPTAHLLSNCIGVGPCLCPISSSVVRMGTASLALMKPEPVSDSWTEDMTASNILLLTRTGALSGGGGSLGLIGSFGLSER